MCETWLAKHPEIAARGQSNDSAKDGCVPPKDAAPGQGRLILSSAAFVKDFVSPDYLVDGLLQRRFCYSFTGKTGTGKTSLTLLLAACVALGKPFGAHDTEQGRVLFFAGENPDDVKARWIALSETMLFDANTIDVCFIPGVFKISQLQARIADEVTQLGGVALVIIDTSATYFEGNEENDNVQAGAHARRLRGLTTLAGGPCVLINCHPAKNATYDNLVPRGGGAFVNEVDGNLTALKDDAVVTLHWQIKYRGADFSPISFMLQSNTFDRLRDTKDRLIPTVTARHISDAAQDEMSAASRADEDAVMGAIKEGKGGLSMVEIARALGWYTPNHEPSKSKVQRSLNRLKKVGFVKLERDRYTLTDKGAKAAKNPQQDNTQEEDGESPT
jgi:hypothetical protein